MVIRRSIPSASGSSTGRLPDVVSEGCAIRYESDGENRSSSAFQLASSEAGTTRRLGFDRLGSRASRWNFRCRRSPMACTVFPSPMSSARHAPKPRPVTSLSQLTPVC